MTLGVLSTAPPDMPFARPGRLALTPMSWGGHARMVIRATRPSSKSKAKCDEPLEMPVDVSTVSTIVFAPGADLVVAGYLSPPVVDHCVRRERTDEALRVLCVSGGNEPLDDARQ